MQVTALSSVVTRRRHQCGSVSDKTIFQVATAGRAAEKIVSFLYGNAEVALDRKAANAAKIVAARDARLNFSAERSRLAQIADWYQDGASLKLIGSRLGVSDVTTSAGCSRQIFLAADDAVNDGA